MITDSKKKMLSQEEIIETALKETKSPYSFEQGKAALMAEAHMPNCIVMREGNTLFYINYDPKDKTRGMFRAINADTARNYLENSKTFIKAAGMAGFKMLISQFKDKTILNIFKYISRNPPLKGMHYETQRTTDGGYQAVVYFDNTHKE
jgi:hypothetical protein